MREKLIKWDVRRKKNYAFYFVILVLFIQYIYYSFLMYNPHKFSDLLVILAI